METGWLDPDDKGEWIFDDAEVADLKHGKRVASVAFTHGFIFSCSNQAASCFWPKVQTSSPVANGKFLGTYRSGGE
jgi:hypothetical protein